MSRRPARPSIAPVNLTWAEVASAYFARGESWLRDHMDELAQDGFPRPDPKYGVFHKPLIDRWWAMRTGLPEPANDGHDAAAEIERALIERAEQLAGGAHGRRSSPLSRH